MTILLIGLSPAEDTILFVMEATHWLQVLIIPANSLGITKASRVTGSPPMITVTLASVTIDRALVISLCIQIEQSYCPEGVTVFQRALIPCTAVPYRH